MALVAATILLAVAAGVASERRFGARAQDGARLLLRGMLFGLVPFVTFFNVARLEVTTDVGVGLVLGHLALLGTGVVAWAVAARGLGLPRPGQGAVVVAAIQANTGYLGLPVAVALLGSERLAEAAAYDALVQTPVLLLVGFAVGAAFGTEAGEGARARARAFVTRNPPLLAALAGLLAPDALAPAVLVDASQVAVIALAPVGFYAVGVTLAAEAEQGVVPRLDRVVATAIGVRLVVGPLLLLALAAPLIDLPDPYLLLAAMPSGINGLVVAHAYGLDLRLAASAIAWSTGLVLVVASAAALAGA